MIRLLNKKIRCFHTHKAECRNLDSVFVKYARMVANSGEYQRLRTFVQHGQTSCYLHSISVAYYSLHLAARLHLKYNARSLIMGAMLHDYCLYDWHIASKDHRKWHGFLHPYRALENAERDFLLDDKTRNIIVRHMFPLVPVPPKCIEGIIVCLIDKYCCIAEVLHIRRLTRFYKRCFGVSAPPIETEQSSASRTCR